MVSEGSITGNPGKSDNLSDNNDYRQAHEKILDLSRLYSVLGRTNEIIVRTRDKDEVCKEVCRSIVEEGGFKKSWIGILEPDNKMIRQVAVASDEPANQDRGILQPGKLLPVNQLPGKNVISEGGSYICNDLGNNSEMISWMIEAHEQGSNSVISLALESGRKMIGVMDIYSARANYFNNDEVKLLVTLAENVSYALETIDMEKDQVVRELRIIESENHYRALFEHSVIPIMEQDFSEVKRYIVELKAMGVSDFVKYFANQPERIYTCASLVRIGDINETAVKFFGRNSKDELLSEFTSYYNDLSLPCLAGQFSAIADGKTDYEGIITLQPYDGMLKHLKLKLSVLPGFENDLSRMLISWLDITDRIEYEEELERSHEELRDLARHIETARENERKAISLNLHDDLGQVLTALKMDIAWLKSKNDIDPEAREKKLDLMSQIIDKAVVTVQRISSQLRPAILYDLGLHDALDWQLNEFTRNTGISHELSFNAHANFLSDEISIVVYRILQEALTNAARHSGATHVEVILTVENNILEMIVHDNGKGFNEKIALSPSSIGLLGLKERARAFNGDTEISSKPGEGTVIRMFIPLGNSSGSDEIVFGSNTKKRK